MQKQNKTHFFFVYIICSALLFLSGLAVCYALPAHSALYRALEEKITDILSENRFISFRNISLSFSQELKYMFFGLVASFCTQRHILFCFTSAFKGMVTGLGCGVIMRSVKLGHIDASYEVFACFVFVVLSVASISLLCYFFSESMIFSKRLVYPPKIKIILKRKDTYSYLITFFAICGAILLVIILKQGDLFFMISPKGM